MANFVRSSLSIAGRFCQPRSHTARHFYATPNTFHLEGEYKQLSRPAVTAGKRGVEVINDPLYNKGTGFAPSERERLDIRGLVPPRQLGFELQQQKVLQAYRKEGDPMRRNFYLSGLQDRNETLFYRLLIDNIEEMAPVVYTPTVGQVCKEFGSVFRRTRGMYFCDKDRGHMSTMIHNWPGKEVEVVVVTDGSRILGLGDLGCNGMGIPLGKLALYVAAGGIHPSKVLPVMLDAGTNNEELLNDPFYLGMKQRRLQGDEFYSLVDEFMHAVRVRWPKAMVQFEDFSSDKASIVLNKYRLNQLCFNDDIQGTGSVTLAGVLGALRVQGLDATALKDQRVLVVGAGSAGLGVATTLLQGMMHQGVSPEEAQQRFWVVDQHGLITQTRSKTGELTMGQAFFARSDERETLPLQTVIERVKPTILLGLTAQGGLFKEDMIREMARHVERPIVFPLSNPTASAECTAAQAYEWSDGRAIVGTGSPFDPVSFGDRTLYPSQCNNMFIFPGVGLGAVACDAKRVTDRMFYAASTALANTLSPQDLEQGRVFPNIPEIRRVSRDVAAAVIQSAIEEGVATPGAYPTGPRGRPPTMKQLQDFVEERMYDPAYVPLVVGHAHYQ